MNICIWFKTTDGPWGGGNQFLRALAKDLSRKGHHISFYPERENEILLINSHNAGAGKLLSPAELAQVRQTLAINNWSKIFPKEFWLLWKRKGPAVVHRLDGAPQIIRGSKSAADHLIPQLNSLSDFTVFQSVYCVESFNSLGIQPKKKAVIYNGVDPDIFFPDTNKKPARHELCLAASSWSSNPRKGFKTLAEVSKLSDVKINFLGRWPDSVPSENVVLLGPKPSEGVAAVLREADGMIHAAENEPCSNAVLEALACGLPILYLDSGGTRELAGDYGVPLSKDFLQDVIKFRESIQIFRQRLLDHRDDFLISRASDKYASAFEEAKSSL
jgi:glycosyltransferase involved in cell wall biosynthesis